MLDVDEPPQFSQQSYNFTVREESMMNNIGRITAIDPDRAKNAIRYDTVHTLKKKKYRH